MSHETELHIDEASMVGLSSAESAKLERLVMLACPFCGGNNLAPVISIGGRSILCQTCGAKGPRVAIVIDNNEVLNNSTLISAWNTRAI